MQNLKTIFDISSLDDTKNLACSLTKNTKKGDMFALYGDIGLGKTTFASFFINCFYNDPVKVLSPTFNIVKIYDNLDFNQDSDSKIKNEQQKFNIWHFDLYRIKNIASLLAEIDIDEAFYNNVSIIEWPEIVKEILPNKNLTNLNFYIENDRRMVEVSNWDR